MTNTAAAARHTTGIKKIQPKTKQLFSASLSLKHKQYSTETERRSRQIPDGASTLLELDQELTTWGATQTATSMTIKTKALHFYIELVFRFFLFINVSFPSLPIFVDDFGILCALVQERCLLECTKHTHKRTISNKVRRDSNSFNDTRFCLSIPPHVWRLITKVRTSCSCVHVPRSLRWANTARQTRKREWGRGKKHKHHLPLGPIDHSNISTTLAAC